ncbi:MAG: hypothetical protein HY695_14900 [Deltaproteobacteria bacterium]|nr:hypothetical protein [Deltaproteobacteria bacterium]
MRLQEIEHALGMVRGAPWADLRNLFLMGHSEGGAAVARWEGNGFKALIISGSRCPNGIRASSVIPVLAIRFEQDPWARGKLSCGSWLSGRGNATEIKLAGSGHDTSRSPEAQDAVLNFLRLQRT